jgi:ethanolamine utilization microcompartment shell protein EutL
MSALDEFADNIDDIVAGHNVRFEKLNKAKRALQVQGDEIAQGWEDYFTNEAKKLQAAKAALSRISNAPLSSASPVTPGNTVLSAVPKVAP